MDGARFCETCGADLTKGAPYTQGQEQAAPVQGQGFGYPQRLRDNWSVGTVTALSVITLGVYAGWFIAKVSKSADVSCAGDGVAPTTGGKTAASMLIFPYAAYLTNVTMKRLSQNAPRYGVMLGADESGKATAAFVIAYLFMGFASLLNIVSIIGFVVCLYVWAKALVTDANTFAQAYNARMGL